MTLDDSNGAVTGRVRLSRAKLRFIPCVLLAGLSGCAILPGAAVPFPDDAAREFQRAIAIDPRHSKAYNNLGVVRMRQGRHKDAAAAFRDARRFSAFWLLEGTRATWP